MSALFELYLSRASDEGLSVDLSRLVVRYVDEKSKVRILTGDVDVKLSFGERLAGKSFRDKWLETLASRVARRVKAARAMARKQGSDLVCGQNGGA